MSVVRSKGEMEGEDRKMIEKYMCIMTSFAVFGHVSVLDLIFNVFGKSKFCFC